MKTINVPKFVKPKKKVGDEFFTYLAFQWNIGAMIRFIEENSSLIEKTSLEVEKMGNRIQEIRLNADHVDSVDLTKPIIIIQLSPFEEMVVDGHHRIFKAMKNNVKELPAFRLSFDQQIQFVTTKECYHRIINRIEEIRPFFEKQQT